MSENLKVWDKLSKTDPKHTKGFTRAGGFKGTAVKPIYTTRKMTEEYGPEGVGWGFTDPQYQVVPASDGQIAVYCWTSLWFNHEGKVSAPVPGVGGDMVVIKNANGIRVNDEAFKAAFTDAKGNALKEIGMSADVHMGLFDDHKYVRERENEERAQEAPGEPVQPSSGPLKSSAQAKRDGDWEALKTEIDACQTLPELNLLVASKQFTDAVAPIPKAWKEQLRDYVIQARREFDTTPSKASDPFGFDSLSGVDITRK